MKKKSDIFTSARGLAIFFLLFQSMMTTASDQPNLLSKEQLQKVVAVRDSAVNSELGYEILESLTTEIGPRMAGTPQDELAVNWALAKLKALGFDKVWKEPVTYPTWQRGIELAEIVSPYPQKLHITALGGSVATGLDGISAPIVHFETLQDLINAEPEQVTGKIVFISHRMTRFRDGKGYGEAVAARSNGAVEAAKKGAQAIVIRSIGTDTHRVPHTGMMRYSEEVKRIPAAALSNPDADQLERILKRKKGVKLKLKLGSFQAGQYTGYNVMGEITGNKRKQELIVIGGHLDSWDLGTGAVDDGAGVAITMAAASHIKRSGVKLDRTIRVILWANEEQGLIGAKQYAKTHHNEISNHITGAESDFGAGRIYEFSSLVKSNDLAFVDQMAEVLKPLGIAKGDNNAKPGPDLIPLYQLGMPVFRLAQDGTDYFDLHHTADDTLDKVDPASLEQNVAAYSVFALMTALYQGDLSRPVEQTKKGK